MTNTPTLHDVAITGAYMAHGLLSHPKLPKLLKLYEDQCGSGHVELVTELMRYAVYLEKVVAYLAMDHDLTYGGIFHYEVAEPLGRKWADWYLRDKRMPNSEVMYDEVLNQICLFFDLPLPTHNALASFPKRD